MSALVLSLAILKNQRQLPRVNVLSPLVNAAAVPILMLLFVAQINFASEVEGYDGPLVEIWPSAILKSNVKASSAEAKQIVEKHQADGGRVQIDDLTYLVLKADLNKPVMLTTTGMFGKFQQAHLDAGVTVSIARCGYNAMMFGHTGTRLAPGDAWNDVCVVEIPVGK